MQDYTLEHKEQFVIEGHLTMILKFLICIDIIFKLNQSTFACSLQPVHSFRILRIPVYTLC